MKKCCDKKIPHIDEILREAGFNITMAKKKILTLISKAQSPLSAAQILKKSKEFNESTIFRNLNQLTMSMIINEIDLGEGFKRYELRPAGHHHHHIKCTECGKIDVINKCFVKNYEKDLERLGYINIQHKLEFFGQCSRCIS